MEILGLDHTDMLQWLEWVYVQDFNLTLVIFFIIFILILQFYDIIWF